MSLTTLLGPGAEALLRECPTEPRLYRRTGSELDEKITLQLMDSHIDHGLVTPAFTAAVKDGGAVHPGRFSRDGQMTPGKLRALFNDGHTVNLREMQRTVPYLAELCRTIRHETGYSLYVSAIITPPGRRGLTHHWDQFTAVVTQMHGHKRWPVWRPEVDLPIDTYLDSPVMWTQEMQDRWDATEPYAVYDLGPGDTLVLPRGWVHSPHCIGEETSFHLTFALRERIALDLASAIVTTALTQRDFRIGIPPAALGPESLPHTLHEVRKALISYLDQADLSGTAETVREALIG
ncbi:JmjC domain-containing protein [Kitasatospora sp. HPMI-4]|uniref:JmjC domain-containing protein n=1 Tax=Kitasatospora sp. HPMI-4 TaxID=3448443 RepID=UPI003F1CFC50